MPTYSEIADLILQDPNFVHRLRLEAMQKMVEKTGRPLLVYASNTDSPCRSTLVDDSDMRALMDLLRGFPKGDGNLDLILHSNGGSPDAADMFACYLREKFKHIRVFVPLQVMSAATMIACVGNEWVLARHSFLGPIDLQFVDGESIHAAQEVLDQYALIRREIKDPTEFWNGAGALYFPTLLAQCQNALAYGRAVAERHLCEMMFAGEPDAEARARRIAEDLADHTKHKIHSRRLSRRYMASLGARITELEADNELQDLVLTVHHCFLHSFSVTPGLTKLIQTHLGKVMPTFSQTMAKRLQVPADQLRHHLRHLLSPETTCEEEKEAANSGTSGTEAEAVA